MPFERQLDYIFVHGLSFLLVATVCYSCIGMAGRIAAQMACTIRFDSWNP